MTDDHHADVRERRRHQRRYGHTTTNPGMRIVMRDLARKDKDTDGPQVSPASSPSSKRVRIRRRRKKHH